MNDYRPLFSRFLDAAPQRLHFAAHSHHFWPDVTLQAQQDCWMGAARYADRKWEEAVFSEVMPEVQAGIAGHLGLSDPQALAFAPNTHEFVVRLLSALPHDRTPHIVTTDSEFHSFARQVARLEEDALLNVTRVATEPFETFPARFTDALSAQPCDMAFFSHVFFNSGYAVPAASLREIVHAADQGTLVVIDGYHGFMALPTDLSAVQDRAFYTAGGYKYAMAGEGACFMHCPPGYALRPRDTGWMASYETLESGGTGNVPYAPDGRRFMGATFDPSGLYRMRAVFNMLAEQGLDVAGIHAHVLDLQARFLERLEVGGGQRDINRETLLTPVDTAERGHFLTFRTGRAQAIHDELKAAHILTDYREDRLRFGFGLYHTEEEVGRLCEALTI